MKVFVSIASLLSLASLAAGHNLHSVIADPKLSINSVPLSTRAHWMRRANAALGELGSPCAFAAFASAIVNHTASGLGELVCIGVNSNSVTGNPTLHGKCSPTDLQRRPVGANHSCMRDVCAL